MSACLVFSILFPPWPQLMSTVDEVLGDVDALHSKLDRKRAVEETNWSTSQQLQYVSVQGGGGGQETTHPLPLHSV